MLSSMSLTDFVTVPQWLFHSVSTPHSKQYHFGQTNTQPSPRRVNIWPSLRRRSLNRQSPLVFSLWIAVMHTFCITSCEAMKKRFPFYPWSSCSEASTRRSKCLCFKSEGAQALSSCIRNVCNLMFMAWRVTPNAKAGSFFDWHGYLLSHGYNSTSSKLSVFLHANRLQYRSQSISNEGTILCNLYHFKQHFHKRFGVLDAIQPPFPSNGKKESTLSADDDYSAAQIPTFPPSQTYLTQKSNNWWFNAEHLPYVQAQLMTIWFCYKWPALTFEAISWKAAGAWLRTW